MSTKHKEIVKTFGNELAMHLTPSNEAMKVVRFAREALADVLRHQQVRIANELNTFSARYPEFGVRMEILNDGDYVFNTHSELDQPKQE